MEFMKVYSKVGEYEGYPLLEPLDKASEVYKLINEDVQHPFFQGKLALAHMVGRLTNQPSEVVLVLSDEEGCFARKGIALKEQNGVSINASCHYVELVLDESDLKKGAMYIFFHELGHILLEKLLGTLDYRRSPKQHTSVGITDYFTAFDEGFAIHFERLSIDHHANYGQLVKDKYHPRTMVLNLWQCDADQQMRYYGVKDGRYAYRKASMKTATKLSIIENIVQDHTSTCFDKTNSRNAQELLSSEGFIAYLFYQLVTQEALGSYDRHSAFGEFIKDYASIVTHNVDTVLAKIAWILSKLADKVQAKQSPLMLMLKEWCVEFPGDEDFIIRSFVQMSKGKTVNLTLSQCLDTLAYDGMIGDMDSFREGIKTYQDEVDATVSQIKANSDCFDQLVPEPMWVDCPSYEVAKCFWVKDDNLPLSVDIHAASVYELQAHFDIPYALALEVQDYRDKNHMCQYEDLVSLINMQK